MKVNGEEVGDTVEEMLTYLSKKSGGIPDWAKKAMTEKAGISKEIVDEADKAGKRSAGSERVLAKKGKED